MTRISLTPIIDVVFILLIFFMLASNFNKIGELKMDMTKETSQSSDEDIKIIKLAVEQADSVISNGKRYDDDELLTMIRLAIKEANRYSIILTAKNDVTYQRYLTVMEYLKKNKIENVTLGIKANETKN
jgi:biopolymer transport protein ExbD|tara:strand:+ start:114 stop:500 length:387 start_codon:yes stop_codon:yes gene_type:complete